jgi:hypothetical protein
MRYTVTPLGSANGRPFGRPFDEVVDDLVRYLRDRSRTVVPAAALVPVGAAATPDAGASTGVRAAQRYYADSGDGPGVWRGLGARDLGLAGEVDDEAFARLLAGRHPTTGEQLLNAHATTRPPRSRSPPSSTGTSPRSCRCATRRACRV